MVSSRMVDMSRLKGRRREDQPLGSLPFEIRRGDFWKEGENWRLAVPIGVNEGFAIANLENHHVVEHDDGMISVLPGGGGSSNSILVHRTRKDQREEWHGYVDHGELYSV